MEHLCSYIDFTYKLWSQLAYENETFRKNLEIWHIIIKDKRSNPLTGLHIYIDLSASFYMHIVSHLWAQR